MQPPNKFEIQNAKVNALIAYRKLHPKNDYEPILDDDWFLANPVYPDIRGLVFDIRKSEALYLISVESQTQKPAYSLVLTSQVKMYWSEITKLKK